MKMLLSFVVDHPVFAGLLIALLAVWLFPILSGMVFIRERQVGIVVKKFGTR